MEARKLAAMSEEEIWQLKDGPLTVTFDDGKLKTTSRRVIFSHYAWEFHRRYPKTPLLMRHCLQDPYVTGHSNLKLLNSAMWDCYDAHVSDGIVIEILTKIAYEGSNKLYNAITRRLESHVTSISALDFLEVVDHPDIREANLNVKPSTETDDHTVDNTYTVIEKVLLDPKQMRENGVAKAARSGLVSMGQILQCVGPRGYATDIDSNIFRNPILVGFYHGFRGLEDMMKESRSAAKALFFTKDPMQKSEYFNRNLQLSAATLSNLHMGDCGSTHFLPFTVKAGDINPGLLGIYYKNDKGKLEMITMGHKHLIGKTIQIRSVFGCLHPDPYGVCSTCFGDLALSFPPNTNIGHFCSAVVQGEVGQRILSTKHEDGSSTVETQPLDDYTRRYIRVFGDENELGLSARTDGAKVTLTIPEEGAKNLFDITFVDDVKSLVTFRITEISRMRMTIQKKGGKIENAVLNIANGPRPASFTHEALQFIKAKGWSNTHNGEYVLDVTGWDTSIPMFELPLTHHNMVEYMKTIEKVVKGTGDGTIRTLMDCGSPAEALAVLYELVSSKMDVSLSHLQVIALTTMAVDPDNDDYRIPKPGMVGKFAAYKDYMAMRSLSSMMAFQRQSPTLLSIKSFNVKIRPKHPLDPLLLE